MKILGDNSREKLLTAKVAKRGRKGAKGVQFLRRALRIFFACWAVKSFSSSVPFLEKKLDTGDDLLQGATGAACSNEAGAGPDSCTSAWFRMSLVTSLERKGSIKLLNTLARLGADNTFKQAWRHFMRPSWRKCARAWWIFVLLLSATCAFGQGSKMKSEFEQVEERDQDNPKAREAWFMRGRTVPTGEIPAALRFRAFQQKMQMRQQFAARAVTAIPHVSTSDGYRSDLRRWLQTRARDRTTDRSPAERPQLRSIRRTRPATRCTSAERTAECGARRMRAR